MNRKLVILFSVVSICMSACNNNSPEETKAPESNTVSKDSSATPALAATYDPDPTDSIAPESYGINSSSKQTADLVAATLKKEFKTDLDKNLIDSASRKFIFFEYDLDDDGKKEIFVGMIGPYFCGTGGCTQYLLDKEGKVISRFSVAGYPVVIDNKKTKGWKDLLIHSGGKDRIVKFDGKKYPSNPSTLPALKTLPGDGLSMALNFTNEPYAWFKF